MLPRLARFGFRPHVLLHSSRRFCSTIATSTPTRSTRPPTEAPTPTNIHMFSYELRNSIGQVEQRLSNGVADVRNEVEEVRKKVGTEVVEVRKEITEVVKMVTEVMKMVTEVRKLVTEVRMEATENRMEATKVRTKATEYIMEAAEIRKEAARISENVTKTLRIMKFTWFLGLYASVALLFWFLNQPSMLSLPISDTSTNNEPENQV